MKKIIFFLILFFALILPFQHLHSAIIPFKDEGMALEWNTWTSTRKAIFVFREVQYYRDKHVDINHSVDFYLEEIQEMRRDPWNLVTPLNELLMYIIAWDSDTEDRDKLIAHLKTLHEAFKFRKTHPGSKTFEEYEKEGVFKDYYKNSRLKEEWPFKDGEIRGWRRIYHDNGILSQEIFYGNDGVNGVSKEYYPNGQIKIKRFYKDGVAEGEFKEFYENGNVMQESFYKAGMLNGIGKQYSKNGKLESEMNFKDDEMIGIFKAYHDNGAIKNLMDFNSGNYKEYYSDGKLKVEEVNKNVRKVLEGLYR